RAWTDKSPDRHGIDRGRGDRSQARRKYPRQARPDLAHAGGCVGVHQSGWRRRSMTTGSGSSAAPTQIPGSCPLGSPTERRGTGDSGGDGGEERLGLAGFSVALQSTDNLAPRPVDVRILRVGVVVAEARVAKEQRCFARVRSWQELPGEASAAPTG